MKKTVKIILLSIGVAVLFCVLVVVAVYLLGSSPHARAVATEQAHILTAVPTRTIRPTKTVAPAITPQPSPTKTILNLDMYRFAIKYFNLTDLQRPDFQKEYTGQWVDWTGKIDNVKSFLGQTIIEIYVPMDYQTAALIDLYGVSKDTAIALHKGQIIHFTGRLDSISYILDPIIDVQDVQIVP